MKKQSSLLVVYNNELITEPLVLLLELQGYRVQVAWNGRVALEMIHQQEYDLVLLDIMIPELNGFEVLRYLKNNPELRHIPVIMLSARDDIQSVVQCIKLGAEDYLFIPFDRTLLKARIEASLDKKYWQDEILAKLKQNEELGTGKRAYHFYSAFISYSSKDVDFAKRLHTDLLKEGVRCWYAPEDLKIGEKFRIGIDQSIRIHDKLLLILSEHSVTSDWVEQEVETALEKEREQGRLVLFPIRLDDAVMELKTGWPAHIRRIRHIGDFRQWKSHDEYREAFKRLLRDLKAESTPNGK